jgi:hypothetical protein
MQKNRTSNPSPEPFSTAPLSLASPPENQSSKAATVRLQPRN